MSQTFVLRLIILTMLYIVHEAHICERLIMLIIVNSGVVSFKHPQVLAVLDFLYLTLLSQDSQRQKLQKK